MNPNNDVRYQRLVERLRGRNLSTQIGILGMQSSEMCWKVRNNRALKLRAQQYAAAKGKMYDQMQMWWRVDGYRDGPQDNRGYVYDDRGPNNYGRVVRR